MGYLDTCHKCRQPLLSTQLGKEELGRIVHMTCPKRHAKPLVKRNLFVVWSDKKTKELRGVGRCPEEASELRVMVDELVGFDYIIELRLLSLQRLDTVVRQISRVDSSIRRVDNLGRPLDSEGNPL